MLRRALLLLAATTSLASAQDLTLAFDDYRAPGEVRYMRSGHGSQLYRSGSLSVVQFTGGRLVTPRQSFVGNRGELITMRHDASGYVLDARRIDTDGHALHGQAVALPDGGFIVLGGGPDIDRSADGVVLRLDPTGRELWRHTVRQFAPPGCDDGTICGFVDMQNAVFDADHVWVSGLFKRGRLHSSNVEMVGRRYMNGFLIKLDLQTGAIVWTRRGGGGDRNLTLVNGDLVRSDGRGDRRWAEHISGETGRRLQRVPLETTGSFDSFIAHGDGYAAIVETHIPPQTNVWHLVGWDSRGRERFRIATDLGAPIVSCGETLLLGHPVAGSYRSVGTVAERVRLSEIDTHGREVRAADFSGWWFVRSLRPTIQQGELALTGVLADGDEYRIASRRASSPQPTVATPPGRAHNPTRHSDPAPNPW